MNHTTARRKIEVGFLLAFLLWSGLWGQDPYQVLNMVVHSYEYHRFTRTDFISSSSQIGFTTRRDGYIKQTYEDNLLNESSGDKQLLEYQTILPVNDLDLGIRTELTYQMLMYDNRYDTASVQGKLEKQHTSGIVEAALSDGRAIWGARISVNQGKVSSPLTVTEYPESGNQAMNTYFLNYLEPAFGQQLAWESSSLTIRPEVYVSIPVGRRRFLHGHFLASRMWFDPRLEYENASNIEALQGQRGMTFPGNLQKQVIRLEWEDKGYESSYGFTGFNTKLDIDILNEIPAPGTFLDIPDLGQIAGQQYGLVLDYRKAFGHTEWSAGIGYGSVAADIDISTPVLGRTLVLPVAHKAYGHLKGSSLTQSGKITRVFTCPYFDWTIHASYHHAYYDLSVEGDAILEFGLTSVPIDYPLAYHLHLVNLQSTLSKQVQSLMVKFTVSQMLPWLVRTDESPLLFVPEEPKVERETRGGWAYKIYLLYRF